MVTNLQNNLCGFGVYFWCLRTRGSSNVAADVVTLLHTSSLARLLPPSLPLTHSALRLLQFGLSGISSRFPASAPELCVHTMPDTEPQPVSPEYLLCKIYLSIFKERIWLLGFAWVVFTMHIYQLDKLGFTFNIKSYLIETYMQTIHY